MIRSPMIRVRLAFATAEADAKIRWRFGRVPTFDERLAPGPFTTLVGYLPQTFAAELAEVVAALPALAEHFRYPAAQLHVTVGAELRRAVRRSPDAISGRRFELSEVSARGHRASAGYLFWAATISVYACGNDAQGRRKRSVQS
jgi:hypothetical protein